MMSLRAQPQRCGCSLAMDRLVGNVRQIRRGEIGADGPQSRGVETARDAKASTTRRLPGFDTVDGVLDHQASCWRETEARRGKLKDLWVGLFPLDITPADDRAELIRRYADLVQVPL